ncbi:hypothetical protein C8R45DRAFT_174186 [Mycena sanguinolenta]|nr:hypothetical protein C8R45DRAFT_174186 [Mycena sanguinolenta]
MRSPIPLRVPFYRRGANGVCEAAMTVSRRRSAFLHPAHAPGCRRGVFEWTLHQVRRHRLCTIHARQAGRTEHGQRDAPVLLVAYVLRLLLDGTSRKRRRDGESLLLLMSGGHGARRIGGQWRCRSKMSGLGCPTRSRVWVSASPIVNTWMHFVRRVRWWASKC